MDTYSEFIIKVMKYIDEKILQLDPKSLDRQRLHQQIKIKIAADPEKWIHLREEGVYEKLDEIFKIMLNEELLRKRDNR